MMRLMGAAAFAAAMAFGTATTAGVYTDDLSRCLVKSSTQSDNTALMQWMFAAMSVNPAITSMTSVTPAQREKYDRSAAALIERLLLKDCRKETLEAVKYEGEKAIEASFSVLGQVAARGLMSDPGTMAGMQNLTTYLDKDKWIALGKEAGTAPSDAKPAK